MKLGGRTLRLGATKWVFAAFSLLTSATAVFAQPLGQSAELHIPWWRVVGALSICLALAVAAAFSLKWKLSRDPSQPIAPAWAALFTKSIKTLGGDARRLRLVETLRLSHQIDICLIRCDRREYIVAASPQGGYLVGSRDVAAGQDDGQ